MARANVFENILKTEIEINYVSEGFEFSLNWVRY
jgi:hypothetical protein